MKIAQEFKEFAMRGSVVDLAVGVIIGAAFGKIVSSLVADVLMPPLGVLLGGINFADYQWTLRSAVGASPAVTLNYGLFIQNIVDFLIVAFVIFLVVKGVNRLRKEKPAVPPEPAPEVKLLTEIRDALKERK